MAYEFLEHTADIKFRASGKTLEELFESCAYALFEMIRGDIKILEKEERKIEIKASDMISLLHNFLEEFLFLLDSEDFLASRIKQIKVDENNFSLKALVVGDKAKNYIFTNDIKAVTYNEMAINRDESGYSSIVVLDA